MPIAAHRANSSFYRFSGTGFLLGRVTVRCASRIPVSCSCWVGLENHLHLSIRESKHSPTMTVGTTMSQMDLSERRCDCWRQVQSWRHPLHGLFVLLLTLPRRDQWNHHFIRHAKGGGDRQAWHDPPPKAFIHERHLSNTPSGDQYALGQWDGAAPETYGPRDAFVRQHGPCWNFDAESCTPEHRACDTARARTICGRGL
jgi:hypothetical protein